MCTTTKSEKRRQVSGIILLASFAILLAISLSSEGVHSASTGSTTSKTAGTNNNNNNSNRVLGRTGLLSNLFRRQTQASSSAAAASQSSSSSSDSSGSSEDEPQSQTELDAQKFLDSLPGAGNNNNSGPSTFRERVSDTFGLLREGVSNQFKSLRENFSDTVDELRDTWSNQSD